MWKQTFQETLRLYFCFLYLGVFREKVAHPGNDSDLFIHAHSASLWMELSLPEPTEGQKWFTANNHRWKEQLPTSLRSPSSGGQCLNVTQDIKVNQTLSIFCKLDVQSHTRPHWRGRRIFWLTDSTNSCKAVRTVYFFWALECSLKRHKDGCADWLPVNGILWRNLDDWMSVCVNATEDLKHHENKILRFMSSWMPTTILSTKRQKSSKAVFELKIKRSVQYLKGR